MLVSNLKIFLCLYLSFHKIIVWAKTFKHFNILLGIENTHARIDGLNNKTEI